MFRPNDELHARVLARVDECVAIVNARRPGFATPPIYYFGNKLTAGIAHFDEHKIGINSQLLERETEGMLKQTVGHEVAHLAAYHLEKLGLVRDGRGHGRAWRGVMRTYFGLDPKRCNTYDTSCMKIRRQRRFIYTCGCPGRELKVTTTKHKRIQSGRFYRCVACKTRVTLKETEPCK